MLTLISNLLGAISNIFGYFKQKRLVDAVEDKMEAEFELEVVKTQKERLEDIYELQEEVDAVPQVPTRKTARRIEG